VQIVHVLHLHLLPKIRFRKFLHPLQSDQIHTRQYGHTENLSYLT